MRAALMIDGMPTVEIVDAKKRATFIVYMQDEDGNDTVGYSATVLMNGAFSSAVMIEDGDLATIAHGHLQDGSFPTVELNHDWG